MPKEACLRTMHKGESGLTTAQEQLATFATMQSRCKGISMKKRFALADLIGNRRRPAFAVMQTRLAMPAVLMALAGLTFSGTSVAEPLPLWEVGVGVGAITLPDYRGSDEATTY